MERDTVNAVVAALGLQTQLAGALLLAAFFAALRGYAERRPYFRAWSLAWIALSASLLAVLSLYGRPFAVADWLGAPAVRTGYQLGKLIYLAFLGAGVAAYVTGGGVEGWLRRALPIGVGYALLTGLAAPTMNALVALQSPAAVAVAVASAWALLRLPRHRASLGSRATALVFVAMAAAWAVYAVAFPFFEVPQHPGLRAALTAVVRHNSYIDLLLQMLLGYGMVVLLMEDGRREVDRAHQQLELAHLQLRRSAGRDPLTSALSRLAFTEGEGLPPAGAPGAVVLADLDNLKVVNDTLGHAAGDALLDGAAAALREAAGPGGSLFRWGGDEFLVVVNGEDPAALRARIVAVCAARLAGGTPLLFSIGAARFGGDTPLEAAIREADAAMYRDKAVRRGAPRPAA